MKGIVELLDVAAIGSLLLGFGGIIIYYALEVLVFFRVLTINMVAISNNIWPGIYVCLGVAACSFILSFWLKNC